MKIYIAGKVTGNACYRQQFMAAEMRLAEMGHSVMSPAWLCAYPEFGYEDYIAVSRAMLERCEAILLLPFWGNSPGAKAELKLAEKRGLAVFDSSDGSERPDGAWGRLSSIAAEQGLCGGMSMEEAEPLKAAYVEGYEAGKRDAKKGARRKANDAGRRDAED